MAEWDWRAWLDDVVLEAGAGGDMDWLGVASRRVAPRLTEEENAALLASYGEALNTREQRFWDEQRLKGERARDPAQRFLSLGPAALEILANLTNVKRGVSEGFGANIAGARGVMDEYAEGVGPDGDPFGSYRRYAEEINAPYPEFSSVLMDFLEPTGSVAKGTAAAVKALGSLGEAMPALGFAAPALRRWDDIITRRVDDVSTVETWGGHYYQYVNPRTGEKIRLDNPPMRVDELPEEVYHVTTNTPAVNASGRLEVSHGGDRGLGGTSGKDSVSFTISREIAESIESDLRTFASLKYFRTFDEVIDFFDALVRREGASPAQIEEFVGRWRKKAPEWAKELETEGLKYFDDDIPYNDAVGFAKNMFKEYSFYRSYWGAPPSSIIMGDPRSPYWRNVQPEDISIITVPRGAIPDEALIRNYDVGRNGLEEIQVYADVRFGN